jgi:hypothetical protein
VDLHFDLLKYGIPDRQGPEIWSRTRHFSIDEGVTVRVLDPEIALVHLMLHANRDRFRHLIAYADLARLLAREQIDWAYVHRFVADEGLDVPVYASLDTMTDTLGLPRMEHPAIGGWRAALWRRLWTPRIRLQGNDGLGGIRRRRRCIALMVRGRALEGLTAWVRGTS